MSLTHEDLSTLKRWFDVDDHKFDYAKNCYIRERAITERLEEVDPAWSLTEPVITYRKEHGEEGMTIVTATIAMTVKGVTRTGVGYSEIELRKDGKREANQPEKSAATDALKRAARLFGIGRYLLTLDKGVKDHAGLKRWFDEKRAANLWTNNTEQMEWLKYEGTELRESVQDDELVNAATKQVKMADYSSAQDYFNALCVRVGEMQSSKSETVTSISNEVNGTIANAGTENDQEIIAQNQVSIEEVAWKRRVFDLTKFLYTDDNGEYNINKHRESMKKRMAADDEFAIKTSYSAEGAAVVVLGYRAVQDLGIMPDEFGKAVDSSDPEMTLGKFVYAHAKEDNFGYGLEYAWKRLQTYVSFDKAIEDKAS